MTALAARSTPAVIAPGATIGILGGGQLGRMTALAARAMGYRIHVLDPDPECATAPVADRAISAGFDDVEASRELARHCDVVTIEIEQIATDVIDAAAAYAPTRPSASVVRVIQDRSQQKAWLVEKGFPVGPYRDVSSATDIATAAREFSRVFVKACRGGYDGRSQIAVSDVAAAPNAWRALGERTAVAERTLDLAGELSVMVARRAGGETSIFPAALNHHERQVLSWSMLPAPLERTLLQRALEIGRGIAEALELEGLIGVELFLTTDGELLVNELAPRPHNSFHATERACMTSQFEQLIRAICGLPFGDVRVVRPAAIVNLFGDLWTEGAPDFSQALSDPTIRLHLYGKGAARPGRKMGHLSAVGGSGFDALDSARVAGERVGALTGPFPESLGPFLAKA